MVDKLKAGDLVVMEDCWEAPRYKNRVWRVASDAFDVGGPGVGAEVVILDGLRGGVATRCLCKVSRDQVEERGMFFCSNCGHTRLVHVPDTDKPHEGCAACGFNEWIFEPTETMLAAKNNA